jgi:hypothetical protein
VTLPLVWVGALGGGLSVVLVRAFLRALKRGGLL